MATSAAKYVCIECSNRATVVRRQAEPDKGSGRFTLKCVVCGGEHTLEGKSNRVVLVFSGVAK